MDTGKVLNMSGKELTDGLMLELENPRSSLLLKYEPVNTIKK